MIEVDPVRAERRKDWALLFLSGGGLLMTAFSAVCLYLVRETPGFVFYLGMASMVQILIVFTGILGLLVARSIRLSRQEISITDHNAHSHEEVDDTNKPS
jgi:hypothetical protein